MQLNFALWILWFNQFTKVALCVYGNCVSEIIADFLVFYLGFGIISNNKKIY